MDALRITKFQHGVMMSLRRRSLATGTDSFPYHTMCALRNQSLIRFDRDGNVRLSVAGQLVLSTIDAMEKIDDYYD
jgi:hypothetical protein